MARYPGRNRGLPRQLPGPEANLIQKPELLRRLTTQLGLRQGHVVPALNDGVQAVVVLDDLTTRQELPNQRHCAGVTDPGAVASSGPPALFAVTALVNPGPGFLIVGVPQAPSTANLRVKQVRLSHQSEGPAARLHMAVFTHAATAKFNNASAAGQTVQLEPYQGSVGIPVDRTQAFVVKYDGNIQIADLTALSFWIGAVLNNTVVQFDFRDKPIFIPPGKGLMVYSEETAVGLVTDELWTSFEWDEEPLGLR